MHSLYCCGIRAGAKSEAVITVDTEVPVVCDEALKHTLTHRLRHSSIGRRENLTVLIRSLLYIQGKRKAAEDIPVSVDHHQVYRIPPGDFRHKARDCYNDTVIDHVHLVVMK